MSHASVELDFFKMEKDNSSKSQFQKLFDRRRSFRGIQSAISTINPEVVKTVIASGSATPCLTGKSPENAAPTKLFSVPSSPVGNQMSFPTLPVYTPNFRPSSENSPDLTQMTIIYNGTVSVFDVSRDKAERIFKLANEGSSSKVEADSKVASSSNQQQLIETVDLPIARKKSLQRFLEKRKERSTSLSPYASNNAFSDKKAVGDLFRAQ